MGGGVGHQKFFNFKSKGTKKSKFAPKALMTPKFSCKTLCISNVKYANVSSVVVLCIKLWLEVNGELNTDITLKARTNWVVTQIYRALLVYNMLCGLRETSALTLNKQDNLI